jgi:hypothetical protein
MPVRSEGSPGPTASGLTGFLTAGPLPSADDVFEIQIHGAVTIIGRAAELRFVEAPESLSDAERQRVVEEAIAGLLAIQEEEDPPRLEGITVEELLAH